MNIKLGDLCSLKNHPYEKDVKKVQISAFASMTPPILVISEILNPPKEHDIETGLPKSKQVRGIFYCHKNHRFESIWVNLRELKLIKENELITNSKGNDKEFGNEEEVITRGFILQKFPRSSSLESMKEKFLNKQVILKSCDLELGKLKTTFSQTDSKPSQTVKAHLDFLPPVLTVIDVKINDEKITFNPKSGNLKKISSAFLLKCKWYNPLQGSFSEDLIPVEAVDVVDIATTVEQVSRLIDTKEFIKQDLKEELVLESGVILQYTYRQPTKLVFKHYKYLVIYYDFFLSKVCEIDLSDFIADDDSAKISDFIVDKIPQYDSSLQEFTTVEDFNFKIENFYRITYKDRHGKITTRIIYVKKFIPKKIIIADCLLRDGYERHFRVREETLLKIEILDQKYFRQRKK